MITFDIDSIKKNWIMVKLYLNKNLVRDKNKFFKFCVGNENLFLPLFLYVYLALILAQNWLRWRQPCRRSFPFLPRPTKQARSQPQVETSQRDAKSSKLFCVIVIVSQRNILRCLSCDFSDDSFRWNPTCESSLLFSLPILVLTVNRRLCGIYYTFAASQLNFASSQSCQDSRSHGLNMTYSSSGPQLKCRQECPKFGGEIIRRCQGSLNHKVRKNICYHPLLQC